MLSELIRRSDVRRQSGDLVVETQILIVEG